MIEQQNLLNQQLDERQAQSNSLIHFISRQSNKLKNLVINLRVKRKRSSGDQHSPPFQLQNQLQISNIDAVSQRVDKNSFYLDLPIDTQIKSNRLIYHQSHTDKNPVKQIGDTALKYKARSSVNGRDDIRIKNVSQIHKRITASLGKNTISGHNMQEQSNPNLRVNKPEKINNKINMNYSLGFKINSSRLNPEIQSERQQTNKKQKQTQKLFKISTKYSGHNNIKSNKLNQRFNQIDGNIVLKYIKKINKTIFPHSDSTPSKIYQFFMDFCLYFGIQSQFIDPLIKRYRNCIYFGQKVPIQRKNTHQVSYYGILYYFRKALYYGQFQKGRKHGYGLQIDFSQENNETIWRGTFQNGKKTGFFNVNSPKLQYNGLLVNSFFDGEGMLTIKGQSTYKGNFQAGMKHGFGIQNFQNHKLLNYKGQFFQNRFQGNGQLQGPNYFYKGSFKNGKADGLGFQRTKQFEYSGQFKNGKKNGKGTLKISESEQIKGVFEEGRLIQEIKQRQINKNQILNLQRYDKIEVKESNNKFISEVKQLQYTKNIKIIGFKQTNQIISLQPSLVLRQQSAIKFPINENKHSSSRAIAPIELHKQQECKNNPLVANKLGNSKNNKMNLLQKQLSKRLNSLYQQNEYQEGTMENDRNTKNNEIYGKYQSFRQTQFNLQNDADEDDPLEIRIIARQ